MKRRLRVQANGLIGIETHEPRVSTLTIAHDIRFRLEFRTNRGWHTLGTYTDALTARQVFAESSPLFYWRLVAFNAVGEIPLPKTWCPYGHAFDAPTHAPPTSLQPEEAP